MKVLRLLFTMSLCLCMFACCQKKSDFDKAVELLDNLSVQLTECTTDKKFEKVYQEIIGLDENPLIMHNYTPEQNRVVVMKTAKVVKDALAVKAILFELPSNIKLNKKELTEMIQECSDKDYNTLAPPYKDVRTMIQRKFALQSE